MPNAPAERQTGRNGTFLSLRYEAPLLFVSANDDHRAG